MKRSCRRAGHRSGDEHGLRGRLEVLPAPSLSSRKCLPLDSRFESELGLPLPSRHRERSICESSKMLWAVVVTGRADRPRMVTGPCQETERDDTKQNTASCE